MAGKKEASDKRRAGMAEASGRPNDTATAPMITAPIATPVPAAGGGASASGRGRSRGGGRGGGSRGQIQGTGQGNCDGAAPAATTVASAQTYSMPTSPAPAPAASTVPAPTAAATTDPSVIASEVPAETASRMILRSRTPKAPSPVEIMPAPHVTPTTLALAASERSGRGGRYASLEFDEEAFRETFIATWVPPEREDEGEIIILNYIEQVIQQRKDLRVALADAKAQFQAVPDQGHADQVKTKAKECEKKAVAKAKKAKKATEGKVERARKNTEAKAEKTKKDAKAEADKVKDSEAQAKQAEKNAEHWRDTDANELKGTKRLRNADKDETDAPPTRSAKKTKLSSRRPKLPWKKFKPIATRRGTARGHSDYSSSSSSSNEDDEPPPPPPPAPKGKLPDPKATPLPRRSDNSDEDDDMPDTDGEAITHSPSVKEKGSEKAAGPASTPLIPTGPLYMMSGRAGSPEEAAKGPPCDLLDDFITESLTGPSHQYYGNSEFKNDGEEPRDEEDGDEDSVEAGPLPAKGKSDWVPVEKYSGPAKVGTKNEALLRIKSKNATTGERKEFVHSRPASEFNWALLAHIRALNSWRRQQYRRGGHAIVKKSQKFTEEEISWLVKRFLNSLAKAKINPTVRVPTNKDLVEPFNNRFGAARNDSSISGIVGRDQRIMDAKADLKQQVSKNKADNKGKEKAKFALAMDTDSEKDDDGECFRGKQRFQSKTNSAANEDSTANEPARGEQSTKGKEKAPLMKENPSQKRKSPEPEEGPGEFGDRKREKITMVGKKDMLSTRVQSVDGNGAPEQPAPKDPVIGASSGNRLTTTSLAPHEFPASEPIIEATPAAVAATENPASGTEVFEQGGEVSTSRATIPQQVEEPEAQAQQAEASQADVALITFAPGIPTSRTAVRTTLAPADAPATETQAAGTDQIIAHPSGAVETPTANAVTAGDAAGDVPDGTGEQAAVEVEATATLKSSRKRKGTEDAVAEEEPAQKKAKKEDGKKDDGKQDKEMKKHGDEEAEKEEDDQPVAKRTRAMKGAAKDIEKQQEAEPDPATPKKGRGRQKKAAANKVPAVEIAEKEVEPLAESTIPKKEQKTKQTANGPEKDGAAVDNRKVVESETTKLAEEVPKSTGKKRKAAQGEMAKTEAGKSEKRPKKRMRETRGWNKVQQKAATAEKKTAEAKAGQDVKMEGAPVAEKEPSGDAEVEGDQTAKPVEHVTFEFDEEL